MEEMFDVLDSNNFIQLDGNIRSITNNLLKDKNVMIRLEHKKSTYTKEYYIDCYFYNNLKNSIEKGYKEGDRVRVRGTLVREHNMFFVRATYLKKIKKD